ncbi:MAG: hypothetical protein ACQEVQ_03385 [Pseudomonadota bacterium]
MRIFFPPLLLCMSLMISACTVSGPKYHYCSVANTDDPGWVSADRERGYIVIKIGVRHSRAAERDIARLAKQSLAENLYSDVHAYTESSYITDRSGEQRLVTDRLINIASNVKLKNVKMEFKEVDGCLAAWASVSREDANIALKHSHPINQAEQRDWESIKDSRKVSDYRAHIERYPSGLYTETAKNRIDVLRKQNNTRSINNSGVSPPAKMFWHLINNIFY